MFRSAVSVPGNPERDQTLAWKVGEVEGSNPALVEMNWLHLRRSRYPGAWYLTEIRSIRSARLHLET